MATLQCCQILRLSVHELNCIHKQVGKMCKNNELYSVHMDCSIGTIREI